MTTTAGTVTDWEKAEIDRANESGLTPVTFVHGLWLLSSSWQQWRDLFEANDFITIAPGWPDDPDTVQEAHEDPSVFAHKMVQGVTDHYLEAISLLDRKPAVIGHSFGGLIAQKIAGEGVAAATVAIDNAPFKGVLPLPVSALKSASPQLRNPANRSKAVTLTLEQFTYGWTNNLDEPESAELYEKYHVAAPGARSSRLQWRNFNILGGETRVDTKNPDRGPLLIIAGEADNTVPLAITEATYKIQSKNPGLTEIVTVPNRGHSLTIDRGWREVAQLALTFVNRSC